MNDPFGRARALYALIVSQVFGANAQMWAFDSQYKSRGKGEGLNGNKRAKSSFKQNKRRGF